MELAAPALAAAQVVTFRGAHMNLATRPPLAGRCGGQLPAAAPAVVLAAAEVPAPAATVGRARPPLEAQT